MHLVYAASEDVSLSLRWKLVLELLHLATLVDTSKETLWRMDHSVLFLKSCLLKPVKEFIVCIF